jgi:hypothetical protein
MTVFQYNDADMEVPTCNTRYSKGRSRRRVNLKPELAKVAIFYLKNKRSRF